MTVTLGVLNVILGLVYCGYGVMTAIEMIRNRDTMGFSHFGMAWIAMAFTCGPHHWVHGVHLVAEGRNGGPLDLFAVLVGFPAGVTWFLLRVEAFNGGRGDRLVAGNPIWVLALPTLGGIYLTALIAASLGVGGLQLDGDNFPIVAANVMLVGLYAAIAFFLSRTQIANRRPLAGWSLSGLALSVVFWTCAAMHGVYALYGMAGTYDVDYHGIAIDVLAVPAAVYFLWVVQALYRGTYRDWNGAPERIGATAAGARA
jgi:hypothetical protein